ncbi:MAG: hypothetical protein D6770_03225 [Anaerolineae bacterium]|nr:MAG: hypothetical protein D6770_03225 [Anaerolineae bacterium]
MELDLGQWIVIGVSAVLILGYIAGYYTNRQKAEQIASWLQQGLRQYGHVSPGEPLRGMATGGQMVVQKAKEPFRRVEAAFLLEPRENPLFWLFHRLQGRRDELVMWLSLRTRPAWEIEVASPADRGFTRKLSGAGDTPFKEDEGPGGVRIAWRNGEEEAPLEAIRSFLTRYPRAVVRLSVRGKAPHIFLRARLPFLRTSSAEAFFSRLEKLVSALSR